MVILKLLNESLLFAINSLVANKLRTLLSLLGITIGIFAIISVFTVIDSLKYSIRTSIESLGDDVVYIQKWPWTFEANYPWWNYMRRPVPKLQELSELLNRTTKVDAAAFLVSTRKTIKYKNISAERTTIMASSHDYDKIWSFDIAKGRYFSILESSLGKNKIILGHEIAKNIFGNYEPIGKEIKILGRKLIVVGVFKKEGTSIGQSMDDIALLPINFARTLFDINSERLDPFIMVKAKKNVAMAELLDELKSVMRVIRKIKPLGDDNFALNRASLIITQFDNVFSGISFAGGIIGGFSIIVGAFGIANIMFVSVKERTHLIGIQKSLGAKNFFILLQFLFESVLLSLLGGFIGLIFVYIGILIANEYDIMEFSLTIRNFFIGSGISIGVGLLAGIFPAYVASRLNPVDAINKVS
ncbi:MAG: FtsX-like permease family protein [Bacteroidetes bacterium]|jgi:putative ABC transport system permease protein|nr:FtsX-like permease family protein [Bacteroidota bacterium]MBT6685736.1 FtsX-like permease family protein [Bacteroidota bacterium]MBT7143032.1 FtsX-like permease family protein [Bacteroidota bacterium]MBT7492441.1 FtsX-like permease family protein [Bacteroidota bacterium]